MNTMRKNTAGTILWKIEEARRIHMTFVITMDKPIDGEALAKAAEDAMEVWPLFRCGAELKDGVPYYTPNDRPIVITKGCEIHAPGSAALNGHMFHLGYQDDKIYLMRSHVITDGQGLLRFMKTLLYAYVCHAYGQLPVTDAFRWKGESYPDDYADLWELDYSGNAPIPDEPVPQPVYVLPENANHGGRNDITAIFSAPKDEFLAFVKKQQAATSTSILGIFARALYRIRDVKLPIVARITANARDALGIPHAMPNCSMGAHFALEAADVSDANFAETMAAMKKSLKRQISSASMRGQARGLLDRGICYPPIHTTCSIAYLGHIDFDFCGSHVKDFTFYEGEQHKINLFEMDGKFHFILHLGEKTAEYANAMVASLRDFGVPAKMQECVVVPEEIYD